MIRLTIPSSISPRCSRYVSCFTSLQSQGKAPVNLTFMMNKNALFQAHTKNHLLRLTSYFCFYLWQPFSLRFFVTLLSWVYFYNPVTVAVVISLSFARSLWSQPQPSLLSVAEEIVDGVLGCPHKALRSKCPWLFCSRENTTKVRIGNLNFLIPVFKE